MARPALDRARLHPVVRAFRDIGLTAGQTARRLGISERSVKTLLSEQNITRARRALPQEMRHDG